MARYKFDPQKHVAMLRDVSEETGIHFTIVRRTILAYNKLVSFYIKNYGNFYIKGVGQLYSRKASRMNPITGDMVEFLRINFRASRILKALINNREIKSHKRKPNASR
jgi:hypothetical protein